MTRLTARITCRNPQRLCGSLRSCFDRERDKEDASHMAMFRRKKPVRRSPGIKRRRRRSGAESRLGYFSVFSLSLGHRGTIKWWDQRSGPATPFSAAWCSVPHSTAARVCVCVCAAGVETREGRNSFGLTGPFQKK